MANGVPGPSAGIWELSTVVGKAQTCARGDKCRGCPLCPVELWETGTLCVACPCVTLPGGPLLGTSPRGQSVSLAGGRWREIQKVKLGCRRRPEGGGDQVPRGTEESPMETCRVFPHSGIAGTRGSQDPLCITSASPRPRVGVRSRPRLQRLQVSEAGRAPSFLGRSGL